MKKLLTAFLLSVFLITLFYPLFLTSKGSFSPCFAETGFLRMEKDGLPFYSDINATELLFYLPESYFLKILSENSNIAHVEINIENSPTLDGYVYSSQFKTYPTDYGLSYPSITLSLKTDCAFYPSLKENPSLYVFRNRTLTYYGEITYNDVDYCYVSYNNKVGYVEKNCLSSFSVPLHPEPILKPVVTKKTTLKSEENTGVRLIIISLLFVSGIVGILTASKPKKKEEPASFYDENDFY